MVNTKSITLDTNAFIHFCHGEQHEFEHIEKSDIILVPTIVIGELAYGYLNSKKQEDNFKTLQLFLNQVQVSVLDIDEQVAREFGNIKFKLKKSGNPIPTNDIWIAALAITNNSTLISRDKHFNKIEGLMVV